MVARDPGATKSSWKRGLAAQSNLPQSTTTPPMTVPWPPIHFVAEWTTMSAPSSIGLARSGAHVLSTMSGTPAA